LILISSYLSCSLFSEILMWFCGLVPRHGTNTLDCRAQWHGTARSGVLSAVPGPEAEHGGTTWHGTARLPCLTVPCLAVPCPAVLVPCSARAPVWKSFIKPCLSSMGTARFAFACWFQHLFFLLGRVREKSVKLTLDGQRTKHRPNNQSSAQPTPLGRQNICR